MKTSTIASYELAYDNSGQIVDEQSGKEFDAVAYSRMKYGDRMNTQLFADALACDLAVGLPEIIEEETSPQFLVAYKEVPPACYYLSRYCLDKINVLRFDNGLEPGRLTQVYKGRVAATNYAAASQEERHRELESIDFSLEGRSLKDVTAVTLDDIRITGSAEKKIVEVLAGADPKTIALGYIAVFNAAQALKNPSVEQDLNASVIRGLADLLPSIQSDNFDLNIRTLKLILSTHESELRDFAEQLPVSLRQAMIGGALGSGHDFTLQYADGINVLRSVNEDKERMYEL